MTVDYSNSEVELLNGEIPYHLTRNRVKCLVTGCPGVGKSSFIDRLCSNNFRENDKYEEKLIQVVSKNIHDDLVRAELEEVDIDEFDLNAESANRDWLDVNWVFLLYSTASRQSFDVIKREMAVIQRKIAPNCFISLIGTKADIMESQVSWKEAEKFAVDSELSIFEISAKNGVNCETVLFETLDAVLERRFAEQETYFDVQDEQPVYRDLVEPAEEADESYHINLFCWVPKIPFISLFSGKPN